MLCVVLCQERRQSSNHLVRAGSESVKRCVVLLFVVANSALDDHPLMRLLSDEDGFDAFLEYCASEFSAENVLFWKAVNDFRTEPSIELALRIEECFIVDGAPLQVNISWHHRHPIHDKLRPYRVVPIDSPSQRHPTITGPGVMTSNGSLSPIARPSLPRASTTPVVPSTRPLAASQFAGVPVSDKTDSPRAGATAITTAPTAVTSHGGSPATGDSIELTPLVPISIPSPPPPAPLLPVASTPTTGTGIASPTSVVPTVLTNSADPNSATTGGGGGGVPGSTSIAPVGAFVVEAKSSVAPAADSSVANVDPTTAGSGGGETAVPAGSTVVVEVMGGLPPGFKSIFSSSQREIFQLLESDSFARFRQNRAASAKWDHLLASSSADGGGGGAPVPSHLAASIAAPPARAMSLQPTTSIAGRGANGTGAVPRKSLISVAIGTSTVASPSRTSYTGANGGGAAAPPVTIRAASLTTTTTANTTPATGSGRSSINPPVPSLNSSPPSPPPPFRSGGATTERISSISE